MRRRPRSRLLLTVCAIAIVFWLSRAPDLFSDHWPLKKTRWEGYAYPDRTNTLRHTYVGEFETLDECRAASDALLRRLHAEKTGDWECGKNCKPWNGGPVEVCEETTQ